MFLENRRVIVEGPPELHSEHNGAKVYKHWTREEKDMRSFYAPVPEEEFVQQEWYCSLCGAEGIDAFLIKRIIE